MRRYLEVPFLSKDGGRWRLRLLDLDCCGRSFGCSSSARHARAMIDSIHVFVLFLLCSCEDPRTNKKKMKQRLIKEEKEDRFFPLTDLSLYISTIIMLNQRTTQLNLFLFALVFVTYLFLGAQLFSSIERPAEEIIINEMARTRREFLSKYPCVKGEESLILANALSPIGSPFPRG